MIDHTFKGILMHAGQRYAAYLDADVAPARPPYCPCCHRLIKICDDDANGCGTGEAGETKEVSAPPPKKQNETWRDREPLL